MYPHFFDPASLGPSLKEVATDVINTNGSEVISRWFHSSKDSDFFIWLDPHKNIIKQQLTFYGQVVEWNIVEGVKTGLIIEDESRAAVKGSDIIQFDVEVQKAPIEQAVHLLRHMTALSDMERHLVAKNFVQGQSSQALGPEEFVRRYGGFLKAPRESWLHRLKSWFRRRNR